MKMKNYSQLVIVSLIMSAAPYFFTNATQLEPGTAPIRTFAQRTIPSLMNQAAGSVAQHIINDKESFKVDVANNVLRIGNQDILLDVLPSIAKQYYLRSGKYLEKDFSTLKEDTIPLYDFSIQELLDNGRLPQPMEFILNLSSNRKQKIKINNLDGLMNIPNLPQLQTLYLDFNQLKDISPLATAHLPQLQSLYLIVNELTNISPLATAHLPQLKTLYLDDNQLTDISPLATATLPQLQTLSLCKNKLTDISPLATANLPQLRTLLLIDNQLTDISPLAITNSPNLRYIDLDNNPINIDTIPPYEETLSLAFKKVISSYRDNDGDTLSHKAAMVGNKDVMANLHLYGLSVNSPLSMDTPNKAGKTPRQLLSDAQSTLAPQS